MPSSSSGPSPLSLTAVIDQALALFPVIEGDVVEVQGATLTLSVGRRDAAHPGLILEVFREGREIRHPRTGQVLGKTEQAVGRAVISEVFEAYSVATLDGEGASAGDRVRTVSGKVRLVLLSLAGGGVKADLIEAATNEMYEGLNRSGRFQVVLGDQIAAWLGQQQIRPDEFMKGRGVREAADRFKTDQILVAYFTRSEKRPFVEIRLFSKGNADPALTAAFFVPASIKPAQPGRFSGADRQGPQAPERKVKSLLARLLGGDLDAGTYSTGESSIPLKEVARFGFPVLSMDVAITPADRVPRLVITDGERIYVYKLVDRALEPEYTYYARALGRVHSVQFVDLTGDGILSVVANRFDTRVGMNSLIVGLRNGKAAALVDQVDSILLAVDETGAGVNQTLWAQRYSPETFFTRGQADRMVIRDGKLVRDQPAVVPDIFRATGAAFSNIMGKDTRSLAFIDEFNRLHLASAAGEQLWRSSSQVGGGGQRLEVVRHIERGSRSFFYTMQPMPLAVDLDGDGIQEIVVPQNQLEGGVLAVVYRGPAGLRFQQVTSGFEGTVTALGAIPSEDSGAPSLIAAVVRNRTVLKSGGETQIIMTTPE
jgi:hypothetical protein